MLCTTTCPNGYYANVALYNCAACQYSCTTCPNATVCTSCAASTNRVLNSTTGFCDPLPGFFNNYTQLAPACITPCLQCTSATVCSTCVNTSYFISPALTCLSCSSAIANCNTCSSSSVCTLCQLGYIVNATTNLCDVVPCIDVNCGSCPVSTSVC